MRTATAVDMSGARDNVLHMSKMIQIRNVPDELHRDLKKRAALAGMSMSDYIKRELDRKSRNRRSKRSARGAEAAVPARL